MRQLQFQLWQHTPREVLDCLALALALAGILVRTALPLVGHIMLLLLLLGRLPLLLNGTRKPLKRNTRAH